MQEVFNKEKIYSELKQAIQRNEFILYYQPQFNVMTSTFDGVEALIRWQHPERGLLLPADFIPVAEESDLIIEIGNWVLKTACLQIKDWQDKGFMPLRVAVNIADRQCKQPAFAKFILDLLREINLSPSHLELELTENIVIRDSDTQVIHTIKELNQAGIIIALDDFGTANSQTSYLNKLPVDRIKIDKIHVQNMNYSADSVDLVKSYILLAAEKKIDIVAEGVETYRQLQIILWNECKKIQGYYFSEPLPADKVEKFLAINKK